MSPPVASLGNGLGFQGGASSPASHPGSEADGFTEFLSKEERRKLRKVEKHRPQFQFDVSQFRLGRKIGIAHIRELVLYLAADGLKPNWIVPENRAFISHTVVVLVSGLLPEHLGIPPIPMVANLPFPIAPSMLKPNESEPLPPNKLPALSQMFTYGVPTRAPGDSKRLFSVMTTLLNSPLPEGLRKKKEEEGRKLAAKANDAPPFLYLLTPNQMIDNDYRLPSYLAPSNASPIPEVARQGLSGELIAMLSHQTLEADGELEVHATSALSTTDAVDEKMNGNTDEGWVETPSAKGPPDDGRWKILALDCEMVLTESGQELARISVVDYDSGENIFDELVKPSGPVVDYRTKWSGITPERLSTATHTLSSIQSTLLDPANPLVTPHTILLGHSLECDLAALKLRHPLCVDTALSFKHPRGLPYKPGLKWLAGKWLEREIQASEGGHDSEEDARACMDLLKLKMANGPDFGTFLDNNETIFERMARYTATSKTGKTSALCDYFSLRGGYGTKATTAVKCTTDDEVLEAMIRQVEGHDFVFGRLMQLANVQGWNGESHVPSSGDDPAVTLDSALEALNRRLTALHNALPRNTALIVLNGHSDPLPMLDLTARRARWERLVKTRGGTEGVTGEQRWLAEDDRRLEEAVGEAREGMAFFCVK